MATLNSKRLKLLPKNFTHKEGIDYKENFHTHQHTYI